MSTFVEEYEQDETDRTIEEHGITGEDIAAMESIEKEMIEPDISSNNPSPVASKSTGGPSGAFLPPGAMPTTKNGQLSHVANEFWFPESRNCPCCKGFKHGCKCRIGTITSCQDPGCTTTAAPEVEYKKEEVKPRHKPVIVFKNNAAAPAPAPASASASAPAPASAPVPAPIVTSNAPDLRTPCTFFNSPQGCRFGAQCRFKHEGVMQSPVVSPSSGGPCKFFQMGQCRNGAACRFSHVM